MSAAIKQCLIVISLFIATVHANAQTKELCPNHTQELKKHAGLYVNEALIELAKTTRIWQNPNYVVSAVMLDKSGKGRVTLSWHETWKFGEIPNDGCLSIARDQITFPQSHYPSATFRRISTDANSTAAIYNLIFKGCYLDESNKKWCFTPNALTVGKQRYPAELMLDTVELDELTNHLKIKSEKLFWAFKPEGDGWLVVKTEWRTSPNYKDIDWSTPWKSLRPVGQ